MGGEADRLLRPSVTQSVTVDARAARGARDHLRLSFDVSFPAMPCHALHVDTMDASGEAGSDGSAGATAAKGGELHKTRLGVDGAPIRAPEYVAPSAEHVRVGGFAFALPSVDGPALDAAFDAREGCRARGWLAVQRVAGALRFAPHLEDYMATRAVRVGGRGGGGAATGEVARAKADPSTLSTPRLGPNSPARSKPSLPAPAPRAGAGPCCHTCCGSHPTSRAST